MIFWSYGLSSIVVFRTSASGVIKLVDDGSSDSSYSVLKTASKQIMQECKGFPPKSSTYQTRIDKGTAAGVVSPMLSTLLQNLTKNQENCLPRIMMGNMISNAITSHPTALQIALGVYLGKKHLIEQFHSLGRVVLMMKCSILRTLQLNLPLMICQQLVSAKPRTA